MITFGPGTTSYLADDPGERGSLVLRDNHWWNQKGPLRSGRSCAAKTQDVLKQATYDRIKAAVRRCGLNPTIQKQLNGLWAAADLIGADHTFWFLLPL